MNLGLSSKEDDMFRELKLKFIELVEENWRLKGFLTAADLSKS